MLRIKVLLAIFIVTYTTSQAQSVKGKLLDLIDNSPLAGATLKLTGVKDTTVKFGSLSDGQGNFAFKDIPTDSFSLQVSYIGYENFKQYVSVTDSIPDVDLGILFLPKQSKQLGEVTVVASTPPTQQKGDTIQYNASQFKVNPDANAEDMIKKMPGITVDKGTVTAQGEQVKKVTIDGREFFGDDATAALRNMPAEVIDKIQVFDRLSDQAQFTGFDDGNSAKAINIITKANMRNGQFGRVYAGYGTDNRYSAGGNVSFFKGSRRISIVGLANNINQQNFAAQDLLGVTSNSNRGGGGGGTRGGGGGGPRGGGGGGAPRGGGAGGFGGFGSSNNFLVGQQSGISKTNAFGINYSNLWGKKTDVTGSYFFNNSNNSNNEISNRQYFLGGDSSLFYNENSFSKSNNYNNRVNLRIEYKIDSSNSLIITPNISFQKNTSLNNVVGINSYSPTNLVSESRNQTNSYTSGYNFSNNILYRHSFSKRGRTISFNFNTGLNRRQGQTYLEAVNKYYDSGSNTNDSLQQFMDQSNHGYQLSGNIAYTEPVGKSGQLQMNYNPSYSKSKADQETFQYDYAGAKYSLFDTTLSNKFDNTYTTQNGGISYRYGNRDNMFSLGMNYQHSKLSGDQTFPYVTTINKTFSNILPNAMARIKFSARSNIRIQYRGSTNAPSITQLQDVINNTNPLLLSTGNPDLKQQYTNFFITRYSFTNAQKGQSFFANLFLQNVNDYIANATYIAGKDSVLNNSITLKRGGQLTKPVNVNGYWSIRSFFAFGLPLKFIKSNLNWNGGWSYSKIPGIINYASNISNNYTYNLGAVLASNVSQYVDFTISYNANFNVVKNSIQPQLDNNYFTQSAGIQLNLLAKTGWFFQNDLTNQSYSGLAAGFNQSYWLWSMSAGKKFLKDQSSELKLSVFDLLKQNRSITRTITETYVEDVQTDVLRQYFMLTFSYKLKNFGTQKRTPVKK